MDSEDRAAAAVVISDKLHAIDRMVEAQATMIKAQNNTNKLLRAISKRRVF